MKNKFKILLALFFLGIILILSQWTSNNKYYIKDIRSHFKGEIIEKVAVRENLLTYVKIKRTNKPDTLIFFDPIKVDLGDSITKKSNEPFCFIKRKKQNITTKEIFVLIDEELIKSNEFPDDWKEKCKNEWKSACLSLNNDNK